MSQAVPWLIFCLCFVALCLLAPRFARVFAGLFFIVMAIAVNWVLAFVAPELFVGLGTNAPLLPLYEWFFAEIVVLAPPLFGIVAGIGEVTIGLLILSRGGWVKLGLAGGITFLLLITPLGLWTLPNPIMAAGLAYLMSKRFPDTLLDIIRKRIRRPNSGRQVPTATGGAQGEQIS